MVPSTRETSRLLAALALVVALLASAALLLPTPLADVFFAGIVLLNPLFATAGVAGAWTNRTAAIWLAALLSLGLTLVGLLSVGLFFAPTAVLLLGSAVVGRAAGPREGVRERILADAPSVRARLLRALAGGGSVFVGAGLVYVGAFRQELFGSCAQETLACAIETTNWPAVGLTLLGFAAVGVGGWLVWKQVYVSRVLRQARAG
ncbi:hypothetical protein B4589_001745 [Halolamina sp. CBA1230]|uniref:hypothetical protein n=1 Tax=Halolamina sp. CBA1230 TaxID=1853690 RepID=UPI0009A23FEE|nr:hypothetical protein [Halolamina sp. CBA1230]QKY19161.1 hypothetical protein B4589_001745 [Halolamina sp. CBA1230]